MKLFLPMPRRHQTPKTTICCSIIPENVTGYSKISLISIHEDSPERMLCLAPQVGPYHYRKYSQQKNPIVKIYF